VIRENNLEDRVELLPRVPVEQIPGLLKDCHAGVIPSRKTEATDKVMMPVKFMEYCVIGLPSVLANLANLKRYIDKDQALFFYSESQESLTEAMLRMVTNSILRLIIAEQSARFSEKHRWTESEKKYSFLLSNSVLDY
jgi:glycosyltransferase involved in cell wall biosynthesis